MKKKRCRQRSRWRTLPTFAREEDNRIAQQLLAVLWLGLTLGPLSSTLAFVFTDDIFGPMLGIILSGLFVVLLQLLKRGHLYPVSIAVILSAYIAVMLLIIKQDGVRDEALLIIQLLLILTATFLGGQMAIRMGVMTVVIILLLFVAEWNGWLDTPNFMNQPSPGTLIMVVSSISLTTAMLSLTVEQLVRKAKQLEEQSLLLQNQNNQLETAHKTLESQTVQLRDTLAELEAKNVALKNYQEDLEELVAQRTQRLSQTITHLKKTQQDLLAAKEAAEVANQAKSTFLANMSHEFRTPLNAILGFTELMVRPSAPRLLSEEHQNYVGIIHRSGEHLLQLINNVLDLSKIEAGRLSLTPNNFDLYRLLDELEQMFLIKAEKKGLQLIFERGAEVPSYVRSDEVKVRQVLINLLNNAIKFTAEGGVSLRVRNADGPSCLFFEVEDTGSGIAPDEMERLFEAFRQSERQHQGQEGTGLGLAISRQFVRLLGGELSVTSQLGVGSCFRFSLPVQVIDKMALTQHSQARILALQPNQPRYRILVVDDKDSNRLLLTKLLLPLGFDVREAKHGKEAIEIWQAWKPHLIWMDMRMPVMDGYEATRRIKATEKGKQTAIIALTASAYEEERRTILSMGCDDFLRKPFREADLFEMMHKHIGVCYVYEKPTRHETSNALSNESSSLGEESYLLLSTLPHRLLSELEQAAVRADMLAVERLISEVRSHDEQLAQRLTAWANEFEYGKIAAWIRKAQLATAPVT